MEVKFFYCKHCGKIIVIVKDSGVPTVCCGENMTEMIPAGPDIRWSLFSYRCL